MKRNIAIPLVIRENQDHVGAVCGPDADAYWDGKKAECQCSKNACSQCCFFQWEFE